MHNDVTRSERQYGSCGHAQIQDGGKFPASRKYNAILDSFVTKTPTMDVWAAKALFDAIMDSASKLQYSTEKKRLLVRVIVRFDM